jgi:hypothetical protein
LFKIANDKRNYGDMTRFVIGFLKFINEASEQVLTFLHEKYDLIQHYFDIVDKLDIDEVCKDILFILAQVSICESESLSIKDLVKASEKSLYIVAKSLQQIKPYCLESTQGRAHLFRANLEALDSIEEIT